MSKISNNEKSTQKRNNNKFKSFVEIQSSDGAYDYKNDLKLKQSINPEFINPN